MAAGMIARARRPTGLYLVTYVLMALTLWILERRRPLWVLPPLFRLLGGNAHGGYFNGLGAVLGGYCGEALFQRMRGQPPKDEKTLWGASLLAILASGAQFRPTSTWIPRHVRLPAQRAAANSEGNGQTPGLWPPSWYSGLLVSCGLRPAVGMAPRCARAIVLLFGGVRGAFR